MIYLINKFKYLQPLNFEKCLILEELCFNNSNNGLAAVLSLVLMRCVLQLGI